MASPGTTVDRARDAILDGRNLEESRSSLGWKQEACDVNDVKSTLGSAVKVRADRPKSGVSRPFGHVPEGLDLTNRKFRKREHQTWRTGEIG